MTRIHYHVIELDLPEVVGACTIGGEPSYSTPLTCSDQSEPVTEIKTHKFTDTGLVLSESNIFKCITSVRETTPKLKAGNGVGSRANCTINIQDFIGDPNLTSPALLANPQIKNQGSFFGKLSARNILANKSVRVLHYERKNGIDTLISTHHYLAVALRRNRKDQWTLSCEDVLYKASDENSDFPKIITGIITSDITETGTTITMAADIADWTPVSKYTAIMGDDILPIISATGDENSVTLTVARAVNLTLGGRLYINEPEDHSAGDEVFRGRRYDDASIYDILFDAFEDADISADNYDVIQIQNEIDAWLPNAKNSIDAVFYEPEDTTSFLNDFCAQFLIDIWTETTSGKINVRATSPWNTTTAKLTEGAEIEYGTIDISEQEELRYSRAFIQYDKRRLTADDSDGSFNKSSLALDRTFEGSDFYDAEKVKTISKSIILSNRLDNQEIADLTTIRYAQRFSNRPKNISFYAEESDINYNLGDVVEIETEFNQNFDGTPAMFVRSQVVAITPNYNVGRRYKINTVTYNPFIGAQLGQDVFINTTTDINLFTTSGGPVSPDAFNFIFDSMDFGQGELAQTIAIGSFPSGSIVNIVLIGGATQSAMGGDGGNGDDVDDDVDGSLFIQDQNGGNGGVVIRGTEGVTVNIYLNGITPDLGNGSYVADGYLLAPGGGGAGVPLYGGGGGAGIPSGKGGTGFTSNGLQGSTALGGLSGSQVLGITPLNGKGGDSGEDGNFGNFFVGSEAVAVPPGLAGKAFVSNGGTFNIITNGEIERFVQGNGDTPDSIS